MVWLAESPGGHVVLGDSMEEPHPPPPWLPACQILKREQSGRLALRMARGEQSNHSLTRAPLFKNGEVIVVM